ncbi:hypothetical protein GGX14DRAFT_403129 [Mycena pura]|uniref:Uncharacterized protein n=1 Tax=Mycena pura TaxID=153505 RepID=A0AAD6Y2Z2_9AGAR|nr:hypothetical protein GGX14DRAFT_403129 [Mycena pura]
MSHVEACLSFPPISPTTGAASSAGAATPLAISAARCASPLQTCSRGVWNVGLIKARLAMCTLTRARAVAAGRQWEGFGSPRSSRVTGVAAAATVGHAERRRHRDREALHRQRGVRGRDYQLSTAPDTQEITIAVQVMVDNLGYFAMAVARVSR